MSDTGEAAKPRLLFLAHRIPYPPNKGDKIRSYHLLRHLADTFDIYLGSFVDDEDDWQYCAAVRRYCAEAFFVRRRPRLHKLLAARGLLTGEALSVTYYRSRAMQQWVDDTVAEHALDRALLFCSPMAQFVSADGPASRQLANIVVDFVDVDSEKWRQYARDKKPPSSWIYSREADCLGAAERDAANHARLSFLVSDPEAALLRQRIPECADKIAFFENGVDTEFFAPGTGGSSPYPDGARVLVFTGAMDYWPNADAVTWFANAVFPALRSEDPALEFWIVGSKPGSEVLALCAIDGVRVTGRVEDVRPYLQHAFAAVAPLRVARGVQNKVLEYMAMERWVLASAQAMEGIDCEELSGVSTCATADDYAQALRQIVVHKDSDSRRALREYVCRTRAWPACIAPLQNALLESGV